MIRLLAAAMLLVATPSLAQSHEDVEKTKVIIHASVGKAVCGIEIPDIIRSEFKNIVYRHGFNERNFANEIAKVAIQRSNGMTALQKNDFCNRIIHAYRNLGVLR